MRSIIDAGGTRYKGNLHMHTTLSDGSLSPQKAAELYRKAGYDFIALTDHWVQSKTEDYDGMLMLPGCEFDTGDMLTSPVYHIVGAGMGAEVKLKRDHTRSPQAIIDAVNAAGGAAILAHPAWSVTIPELCMGLEGLSGTEIYNSVSGLPWNARPDSSVYIDIWAAQGKLFRCTAADDSHGYNGEQTMSFIMLKAEELTREGIVAALKKGDFYASQGPLFESVTLEGGDVKVKCSKVETVVFYSNTVWCEDRVITGGVTGAEYHVKPTDRYLRVELIDSEGRRAWCSPFAV